MMAPAPRDPAIQYGLHSIGSSLPLALCLACLTMVPPARPDRYTGRRR
jgi:hypothetical protein